MFMKSFMEGTEGKKENLFTFRFNIYFFLIKEIGPF